MLAVRIGRRGQDGNLEEDGVEYGISSGDMFLWRYDGRVSIFDMIGGYDQILGGELIY